MKAFVVLIVIGMFIFLILTNCSNTENKNPINSNTLDTIPKDTTPLIDRGYNLLIPDVPHSSESMDYIIKNSSFNIHIAECLCQHDSTWKKIGNIKAIPFILDTFLRINFTTSIITLENNLTDTLRGYKVYKKLKGTTGLYGLWKLETAYVKNSQLFSNDSIIKQLDSAISSGLEWIIIDTITITTFSLINEHVTFTAGFQNSFNLNYQGKVAVTFHAIDDNSIKLIGEYTNDTVDIVHNVNTKIVTFSSPNNSKLTLYKFDPKSSVCPNPRLPSWFESEFLVSNVKKENKDT